MEAIKSELDKINPALFYAIFAIATHLLIYGWRKLHLASFDAVTRQNPALQALPATILGALLASSPAWGHELGKVLIQAVLGAVTIGGGAILTHHGLKAIPFIPYTGARQETPLPDGPLDESEPDDSRTKVNTKGPDFEEPSVTFVSLSQPPEDPNKKA